MFSNDDDARSVLAGLSSYAARPLPSHLTGVARQYGLPIDGWVFDLPTKVDDAASPEQLHAVGRTLRDRAGESGITMLIRGDAGWPAGTVCDQLPCLWVRGDADIAGLLAKAITITGTRASTPYGGHVASQLAHDVVAAGFSVITAASQGINIGAALGAITHEKPALVLLAAAGLDYRYTNATVGGLITTAAHRSAVISAFPPGYAPSRSRWQLTDRLIGSLSAATVIVEAPAGSRSLRSAQAAMQAGRTVCAVPGPVTSAASAGCHQLIADGAARLVTHAGDIVTALGTAGTVQQVYQVTATARWYDRQWRQRTVPVFHVKAASHAHAANAAFDIIFPEQSQAVTLAACITDPAGVADDITIVIPGSADIDGDPAAPPPTHGVDGPPPIAIQAPGRR